MKIKTSELIGSALDWAVAKCEEITLATHLDGRWSWLEHEVTGEWFVYSPSTNWTQGGPIIEREEIGIKRRAPCMHNERWEAMGSIMAKGAGYRWAIGPTPLIATMRCFVASKLGDEVEIPEELIDKT